MVEQELFHRCVQACRYPSRGCQALLTSAMSVWNSPNHLIIAAQPRKGHFPTECHPGRYFTDIRRSEIEGDIQAFTAKKKRTSETTDAIQG